MSSYDQNIAVLVIVFLYDLQVLSLHKLITIFEMPLQVVFELIAYNESFLSSLS